MLQTRKPYFNVESRLKPTGKKESDSLNLGAMRIGGGVLSQLGGSQRKRGGIQSQHQFPWGLL